ncbi:MAG: arylsulfatase [Acidimicrobiia bacterium]|nr:MAG: arylsulfatase [Acidimicrobiia bacterium]
MTPDPQRPSRPNLLLITTDMQRYDTVGPDAPEVLRTPHLDQLTREGAIFERAYAESPMCVPSRLSMMTGQSVATHGVIGNTPSSEIIGRQGTLPDLLRSAGYQTAGIGKMHFGPQRARHGFDETTIPDDYYRMMERQGDSGTQPMRHGIGQNEMYPARATVHESRTLTAWIAEECVKYIRYRRDPTVPFFLWCSFSKPHPPLDPPEPYYSMYDADEMPRPVRGDWSTPENCPPVFRVSQQRSGYDTIPESIYLAARAAYFGLITHIDYVIGRIFTALQDIGEYDSTMMMFTSDHGEYLGDHGASSTMFFHEVSARVPMILRLPKGSSPDIAGRRIDSLVTHADVLETFVTAAGSDAPPTDGRDLVAVARGEIESRPYIVGTTGLFPNRAPQPPYLAITDARYKYIWYPEGGVEQFFDLQSDPTELTDLSVDASVAEAKSELRRLLIADVRERRPEWLADGELAYYAPLDEPLSEVHRAGWPGYIGELSEQDTRH